MGEKKKVMVVGQFSPRQDVYTYASSFHKAFGNLGYSTKKLALSKNIVFSNVKFYFSALKFNPNLIFLIKSKEINFRVVREIKKKLGCSIANFYPDNPFVFWNGNSGRQILNSLPIYDFFLIWSKMLVPVLESAGCKKVYYFPFAIDESLFNQKTTITDQDKKRYESEVCFIGTWEPEREIWLTKLCQKRPNLRLSIWGNLWNENLSGHSIIKRHIKGQAIYGAEMIKAFRCSKIVLNFIRKQNTTAHNMRTFEVPASRAFLLTQRTEDQSKVLFSEGENIECFSTIDELCFKIKKYLADDPLRKKIVRAAFERSREFTLQKKLKKFIKDL